MKIKNEPWCIRKFVQLRDVIDPRPQYQRGEVWSLPKQQLLLDSVLNGVDIPKIYLRVLDNGSPYKFEVADGQQRLLSLWGFIANEFPLAHSSGRSQEWSGKCFNELTKSQRDSILKFSLITAVIEQASEHEIRDLFARLQKGERLTPPELRNSMASVLGDVIRAMALSHPFFQHCSFPNSRFKHDDYLAHAFALELNGVGRDLKANELRYMYETYSGGLDDKVVQTVNKHLKYMSAMLVARPRCISTKWGFCDVYFAVSSTPPDKLPDAKELAKRYAEFEGSRQKHSTFPEVLIASRPEDKVLYKYIMAFIVSGGESSNLKIRHESILTKLDLR
jgi:hypothetical protein